MRTEFERAGVWALMRKKIAASIYTQPGDPMKIDCGYRPNGVIKMFHAVSLDADVEAAKVLAFTAPRLHEGVQRVEGARLELTAVVEPLRAVGSGTRRATKLNPSPTPATASASPPWRASRSASSPSPTWPAPPKPRASNCGSQDRNHGLTPIEPIESG